ncbi:inositol monophosphatase [Candidatus Woesearchaeota archaeon]|nr:inositol monophosphatase [Candidatus Woesearchaeota archaeon]
MDLSRERKTLLEAANAAAKAIMQYYGKKESIKIKPNKSLVAAADLAANKAIIKAVKRHFPDHSILSEETGFEDNGSDFKWVIDPIDGTHNFLRRIPIFGTSIALEYKNEVVLGALHFPVLKITAIAERGKGAFLNGKRIKVSGKKGLEHAFVLIEFSYANRGEKIGFLSKFVHKTIDIRNFGSAIFNLLMVASGSCESYVVMSTQEWDVAAGFLMVEEAGGKITDLKGKKWNFEERKYIISNSKVHKKMLEYMK